MKLRAPALLLAASLAGCGGAEAPPPPPPVPVFGAQSGWARVSDEIIDWYLSRHPYNAVMIGDDSYDTIAGSYFPGDLERARHDARSLLTRLQSVSRSALSRDDYFDHRMLEHGLREELLDLEEIGGWQRDPTRYLAIAFPPAYPGEMEDGAAVRMMTARWTQMPLVLRAARQNLTADRVSPVLLEGAAGAALEIREALSGWNPPLPRDVSPAEWQRARALASASIDSFTAWLDDMAPRATGGGLGPDNLARKLLYSSHVDIPLDQLDRINRQAIDEHREWLERVALEIDPMSHPEDIIASLREQDENVMSIVDEVLSPTNEDYSVVRALFAPERTQLDVSHYASLADVESEAVGNVERIIEIRRALHGHALLHGMLQIHANGASIEDAARDMASIALLDEENAMLWAGAVLYDPEFALLALDRMQIFALRERLRARGGTFDEQAFREQLLNLELPIPLAAEALLGDELDPLLVVGQRTPGVPEPPTIRN